MTGSLTRSVLASGAVVLALLAGCLTGKESPAVGRHGDAGSAPGREGSRDVGRTDRDAARWDATQLAEDAGRQDVAIPAGEVHGLSV